MLLEKHCIKQHCSIDNIKKSFIFCRKKIDAKILQCFILSFNAALIIIFAIVIIIIRLRDPVFDQIRFRVFTIFHTPPFSASVEASVVQLVCPSYIFSLYPPLVIPPSFPGVYMHCSLVESLFPFRSFRSLIWQYNGVYIGYRVLIYMSVDNEENEKGDL